MFGGGGHKKASGFQLPKNKHVEDLFDKPKSRKTSRSKKTTESKKALEKKEVQSETKD